MMDCGGSTSQSYEFVPVLCVLTQEELQIFFWTNGPMDPGLSQIHYVMKMTLSSDSPASVKHSQYMW